jgi:hypothetical protein
MTQRPRNDTGMAHCPQCDYPIPDDRERVGARCPTCRDPLYEPVGRVARPAREGGAACPVHAGMESVGVCRRCGVWVCETCRTRWRGQVLCAACVEKALAAGEAAPEEARESFRQGVRAVVLGSAAWVAALLSLGALGWFDGGDAKTAVIATFLVFVMLAASVLAAAAGTGLAIAALRAQGGYRTLALTGLLVGGLYVGVALGIGALGLWQL